jgi:uncharacterized protein (TIGR03435 family)
MRVLSLLVVGAVAVCGQRFEVVSVKPHIVSASAPLFKNPGASPIRISGNRVTLQRITLKDLVQAAYGVNEYQVAGGPGWAGAIDSMWDVEAKTTDASPDLAQVRPMLQALLADRFQLKLARSSKEHAVYNLVIAKGSSKLKPVAAEAPAPTSGIRRGTMAQISGLLGLFLDRPVIDQTGLEGSFDYPADFVATLDRGHDPAAIVSETLTLMQEQLGLKAEPAKAMIETLVIDSAQKPSSN